MRHITIIGAGQAGLQLGLGLRQRDYDVTLVSDRTPAQIRQGRATGAATLFGTAIALEQSLGHNAWTEAPRIKNVLVEVHTPQGTLPIQANPTYPWLAVDQRLKHAHWLQRFAEIGGRVIVQSATLTHLEAFATHSDLVVVAAGARQFSALFRRDNERSIFDHPQRRLLQVYVSRLEPWSPQKRGQCKITIIPGVAEIFFVPFYTTDEQSAHVILIEAVPGGPLDDFDHPRSGADCLAIVKRLLQRATPWHADQIRDIRLTDDNAWLAGEVTPTVRRPVGYLPSGAAVMGLGDVVILNDPVGGQGANNATKFAHLLLNRIDKWGNRPFAPRWMEDVFEEFWTYSQYVNGFNIGLLKPPAPHQQQILGAASQHPTIAADFINGFDEPSSLFPWFADPDAAERYLLSHGVGQPAPVAPYAKKGDSYETVTRTYPVFN